ncbi:MAG: hypothetical protein NZ899_04770 [Thermoguttaceae bacterium]|nr:hypothetical protein [Thermoguttaceae bacterium]MDW8077899.1 BRCT domain-containing protein [Thermoguttaceae bacterium]
MAGRVDRPLEGRVVVLLGRFAGASQSDVGRLIKEQGGTVWPRVRPGVHYVVLGEEDYPLGRGSLPEAERRAILDQTASIRWQPRFLAESELWEWLGLLRLREGAVSVFALGIASQLSGVDRLLLRRWIGLGLLRPRCWVFRSPYLDFGEISLARQLGGWVKAGILPRRLEAQLEALARWLASRAHWPENWHVRQIGPSLFLEGPLGLVDPTGQMLLFSTEDTSSRAPDPNGGTEQHRGATESSEGAGSPIVRRLVSLGIKGGLENSGGIGGSLAGFSEGDDYDLAAAIEAERLRLAIAGPSPEGCFQLAELLYRAGELQAARERYWMALELDENFVEARVNLGCVLAELGDKHLARAAFQGALDLQPDCAEAHWHLASLLEQLGCKEEAQAHWLAYLRLAPEGPWAEIARSRLERLDDPEASDLPVRGS